MKKKVYIQQMLGQFPDDWTYAAWQGAQHKGYEIIFFEDNPKENEIDRIPKNQFVIGWIDNTIKYLNQSGIKVPTALNIPAELNTYEFTKRNCDTTSIWDLKNKTDKYQWPLFIKPLVIKKFASGVLKNPKDIKIILNDAEDGDGVAISTVIDMKSEYRCFVQNGKLIGIQWYAGDFKLFPDVSRIEKMIKAYTKAPVAYTLDVAVVNHNDFDPSNTVIIECNDAWSICNYGLVSNLYFDMLEARWAEMVKDKVESEFPHVQLLPHEESLPKVTNEHDKILQGFEELLKNYEEKLVNSPGAFYEGLVKNTKEAIERYKSEHKI